MTGTNGPTGGNGREPGKGLVDIPKLSAQRKEEIRSEILTGIRSWTKEPEEEPKRARVNKRRRRLWTGGGIGAGFVAVAVAAVLLVQNDTFTNWGAAGSGHTAGVTGETGRNPTDASPGKDSSPYAHELSIAGIDTNDMPEGIAEPLLPLTYEEFRSRWEANASSERVAISAADKDGQTLQNALPRLNETRQNFGEASSGYGYTAWSSNEDGKLRELVFQLGDLSEGVAENPADSEVVRYVTTVLQPGLPETEREALLDQLRFRDFEAKGGSRIAESGGLVYTLDRNEDKQRLIVQFMRAEDQPDALGKWQDSLLDIVRG
ncbi:hypothetical protein [Saccharibacillus sacchari]|uniref:hypothetical protein n=1 Tax=Saccharibacillus sacchari TaxID=456493 RepID=UPI0004B0A341|nr:hypothetical protein [Saccharibacillus sacchari]